MSTMVPPLQLAENALQRGGVRHGRGATTGAHVELQQAGVVANLHTGKASVKERSLLWRPVRGSEAARRLTCCTARLQYP